jgi:hypothetical protein
MKGGKVGDGGASSEGEGDREGESDRDGWGRGQVMIIIVMLLGKLRGLPTHTDIITDFDFREVVHELSLAISQYLSIYLSFYLSILDGREIFHNSPVSVSVN